VSDDRSIICSDTLETTIRATVELGQSILEVGSGPQSSPWLAGIALDLDVDFYSVDVSGSRLSWVEEPGHSHRLHPVKMKGEEFLAGFDGVIGFAYMDSFDWADPSDPGAEGYGRNATRRESELVHLEQTILLLPRLAPHARVLFDDTWLLEKDPPASGALREPFDFEGVTLDRLLRDYDVWGKGSLAVPYLLCSGYRIAALAQRPHATQVLLEPGDVPGKGVYGADDLLRLLAEHRSLHYPSGGARITLNGAQVALRRLAMEVRTRVHLRTRLRRLVRRFGR
jgi:hypothetical protein